MSQNMQLNLIDNQFLRREFFAILNETSCSKQKEYVYSELV